jgi:AraC-like DNA-binding protein
METKLTLNILEAAKIYANLPTNMRTEPTVSVKIIWAFIKAAQNAGVLGQMEKYLKIDGEKLYDSEIRVRHSDAVVLMEKLVETTDDPTIGLKAAENILEIDFDILEYVAATAATPRDAVTIYSRYGRFTCEALELSIETQGDKAFIGGHFSGLPKPPIAEDFCLATFNYYLERWGPPDAKMLEVRFTYPRPAHARFIEEFFRAPCRFSMPKTGMVWPISFLDTPNRIADSRLHSVLVKQAQDLLDRMPHSERFSDRVRALATHELCNGNAAIKSLCNKLKVSESTYRRRLREEGITHRYLIDNIRGDLARVYLSNPDITISQIAFLLGFSQLSAFTNAFRRWNGVSPAQYRKRLRSE